MDKEGFEVGDKLVPKNPDLWVQENRIIWKAQRVSTPYVYVCCRVNGGELNDTYIKPIEMKHLYKKGEQMICRDRNGTFI